MKKLGNWIIFLGAGPFDYDLVISLKNTEFNVCVVDGNKDNKIQYHCDLFLNFNVLEEKKIYKAILNLLPSNNKVFVYSSSELSLFTGMFLKSKLNDESFLGDYKRLFFNKTYCKLEWEKNKILTPRFYEIDYNEIDYSEIKRFELPIIIKPINGFGGDGVTKLSNRADVDKLKNYIDIHKYSKYILEEYIEGREFNVSGWFIDGNYFPSYICEIKTRLNFSADTIIFGCILTDKEKLFMHLELQNAASILNINNGPISGSFIKSNLGNYLLEVAPIYSRFSSHCLLRLIGSTPLECYLNHLIGRDPVDFDFLIKKQKTKYFCSIMEIEKFENLSNELQTNNTLIDCSYIGKQAAYSKDVCAVITSEPKE